jgi:hypothetical protein
MDNHMKFIMVDIEKFRKCGRLILNQGRSGSSASGCSDSDRLGLRLRRMGLYLSNATPSGEFPGHEAPRRPCFHPLDGGPD